MPIVYCRACSKSVERSNGRINENKKFGHSFYCSRKCQGDFLRKRVVVVCENSSCAKAFEKLRKEVGPHDYCSLSCAAIVNNHKKHINHFKICRICRSKYKGENFYCSKQCAKDARRDYSPEELLKAIQSTTRAVGRVPAKREIAKIAGRCIRTFGSWNKAIKAAGLTPNRSHDRRMYKRTMTKAKDGHLCDSVSEAIIDNWLTDHGIKHERDYDYPSSKHKTDWAIDKTTFIEYFGLAKDSPRYDRAVARKIALCEKHRIRLISLYPNDLYPSQNLERKLAAIMASR